MPGFRRKVRTKPITVRLPELCLQFMDRIVADLSTYPDRTAFINHAVAKLIHELEQYEVWIGMVARKLRTTRQIKQFFVFLHQGMYHVVDVPEPIRKFQHLDEAMAFVRTGYSEEPKVTRLSEKKDPLF